MGQTINEKALQTLDDLETYLSQVKPQLFSSNRIVVDRIEIQKYLYELRQYLKVKE